VLEERTAMRVQNCLYVLGEVVTTWNSKIEKSLESSWARGRNQALEEALFAVA